MEDRRRQDPMIVWMSGIAGALKTWQALSSASPRFRRRVLLGQALALLPRAQRLTGLEPPKRGDPQPPLELQPRERIGRVVTGMSTIIAVLRLWLLAIPWRGEEEELRREWRQKRAPLLRLRRGWKRQNLVGQVRLLWQVMRWRYPARSARWRAVCAGAAMIAGIVTALDDRRRFPELEKLRWFASRRAATLSLLGQMLLTVAPDPGMFWMPRRGRLFVRVLIPAIATIPMGLIGLVSIRQAFLPADRLRQEHDEARAFGRQFERRKKRRKKRRS